MSEKITVIIPIYKVEKYLDRCVESVVNQTYSNLEIILVDDGSTDNCPNMCDEWANKDNRIVVIHKQNGGLSDARNAALDICTGKYVTFVDSDDTIESNMVEYLYGLISENSADLSICDLKYISENAKVQNRISDNDDIVVMNKKEALKNLCEESLFSNSACAKMYKTSDFKDIRYPKGKLYEDIATTYKLIMKASKVVFGYKALYNYILRGGSITTSKFSYRKLDAIKFAEQMCNEIVSQFPDLKQISNRRMYVQYFYAMRGMVLNKKNLDDVEDKIKDTYKMMKNTRADAWKCGCSRRMKFFIISSMLGRKALECIIKIEALLRGMN